MTYARKNRIVQRYRNVGGHRVAVSLATRPMGGWFDDIISGITGVPNADALLGGDGNAQCLAQGNAAAAQFDAKQDDLNRNWHPNGFYDPTEMGTLISQVFSMLHAAEATLEQVNITNGDIKNAQDEIFRKYAEVQTYQNAAAQAKKTGQPINAPGFRDWVIKAMGTASAGVTAAVVTSCMEPWWVGALSAFQTAFDAVYNLAKRIVGIVIAAGETVLTVAESTFDVARFVAKWGPWAALGLGAYIGIKELKKRGRL